MTTKEKRYGEAIAKELAVKVSRLNPLDPKYTSLCAFDNAWYTKRKHICAYACFNKRNTNPLFKGRDIFKVDENWNLCLIGRFTSTPLTEFIGWIKKL